MAHPSPKGTKMGAGPGGQPVRGATTPSSPNAPSKGNFANKAFKGKSRGFKGKISS